MILRLKKDYNDVIKGIGFSGHHKGIAADTAALAYGATLFERHFTLDRTWKGTDHAASLEFNEFKQMVDGIREVEEALGENKPRVITQGEMINRDNISFILDTRLDEKTFSKKEMNYSLIFEEPFKISLNYNLKKIIKSINLYKCMIYYNCQTLPICNFF